MIGVIQFRICLSILFIFSCTQLLGQNSPDTTFVFFLDEYSSNGTVTGTVTGLDPQGDPLIFSIVSGNGSGAFDINSTTGDVVVADESQMIFLTNPLFVLGIEGDDGDGGIVTIEARINLVDVPLGLGDLSINVYPNPAQDLLTIRLDGLLSDEYSVGLFTVSGSQVLTGQRILSQTDQKIEIQLEGLNSGIYLLKIGYGAEVIVKNILIK